MLLKNDILHLGVSSVINILWLCLVSILCLQTSAFHADSGSFKGNLQYNGNTI